MVVGLYGSINAGAEADILECPRATLSKVI